MNNKELLLNFINYCEENKLLPELGYNSEQKVDDYLSSRNIGNTNVSRSFSGRDETDAEIIEQAKKLWKDEDIDSRKLKAVKHLMANGWGLKVAHEYCISNFG